MRNNKDNKLPVLFIILDYLSLLRENVTAQKKKTVVQNQCWPTPLIGLSATWDYVGSTYNLAVSAYMLFHVGFISSGALEIQSGKQRQPHFTCQSRSHKEGWIAAEHTNPLCTKSLITFILAQSITQLYHLDKNCEKSAVQTEYF